MQQQKYEAIMPRRHVYSYGYQCRVIVFDKKLIAADIFMDDETRDGYLSVRGVVNGTTASIKQVTGGIMNIDPHKDKLISCHEDVSGSPLLKQVEEHMYKAMPDLEMVEYVKGEMPFPEGLLDDYPEKSMCSMYGDEPVNCTSYIKFLSVN